MWLYKFDIISPSRGTLQLDSSVGPCLISRCGESPGCVHRSGPAIPAQSSHMKSMRSMEAISEAGPNRWQVPVYKSQEACLLPSFNTARISPKSQPPVLTKMKFFAPIALILQLAAASPAAVPRQGLATPSIVPGDVQVIGVSLLVCPRRTPCHAQAKPNCSSVTLNSSMI